MAISGPLLGAKDLVESGAVGEVVLVGLGPAAKSFVDGEELDPRKLLGVLRLANSQAAR